MVGEKQTIFVWTIIIRTETEWERKAKVENMKHLFLELTEESYIFFLSTVWTKYFLTTLCPSFYSWIYRLATDTKNCWTSHIVIKPFRNPCSCTCYKWNPDCLCAVPEALLWSSILGAILSNGRPAIWEVVFPLPCLTSPI